MPRYSRKHKRGGRPPNTSTDDAEGNSNGQRIDDVMRDNNTERENNLVESYEMSMEPEIGQVDPRSVGLTPEQSIEYEKQLEEGNRLAAQDRRRGQRMERQLREGRQGPFTRIEDDHDDDNDDNSDDQFAGRKRRKTVKKRKTAKKRKTSKKRKTAKKRKTSKKR
jgi:hypothetical protein